MVLSPAQQCRLLGDITGNITNTPPSRERVSRELSPPATPPSFHSADGSPTATANVQRFSLRSRSARLRMPRALGERTADPCLGAGRRRLCKRATDDHDEYRLLELLNSRFISDCPTGGELIATKACLNEMDTFFILEPFSDAVMGYAAFIPAFDHGIAPGSGGFCLNYDISRVAAAVFRKLLLLSQLYVEPLARKKGLATAALRVLLASHGAAVVESPSLATARTMSRLGFKPVGAQWSDGYPRVLYVRLEALESGFGADENS